MMTWSFYWGMTDDSVVGWAKLGILLNLWLPQQPLLSLLLETNSRDVSFHQPSITAMSSKTPSKRSPDQVTEANNVVGRDYDDCVSDEALAQLK